MEENLRHLREKEGDTELTRALTDCVENYRFRRLISSIRQQDEERRASTGKPISSRNRRALFEALWPMWGSWLTKESLKGEFKRLVIRRN
jgi:hypothetical protein